MPAALLAGAYGSQYWGGLYPVRDVLVAALRPFRRRSPSPRSPCSPAVPDRGRSFVWLAALAILASGAIGVYHAGVELDYSRASPNAPPTGRRLGGDDLLKAIMEAPLVRCDEVQWSFLGISMAAGTRSFRSLPRW